MLNRAYGPPLGQPALTLARVPLIGGIPREVLADVQGADWSPDGRDLAIIREVQGHHRLEYPVGRVLYETDHALRNPRVSPKGDRVAFVDWTPEGFAVSVVDLRGSRKVLSGGWSIISKSLAWSPDGSEVWFTGDIYRLGSIGGQSPTLHAVTLKGRDRLVMSLPEFLNVHDISGDGRVLMAIGTMRSEVFCLRPGETHERNLSWHESSDLQGLSRDGQSLLIVENVEQAAYLRKTDGSPAVQLGEPAESLSPDARWAVAANRKPFAGRITLIPTGAGEPRVLDIPKIRVLDTSWFPDGERLLLRGAEEGRAARMWSIGLDGTPPRAITEEGMTCGQLISPDGKLIVCPGAKGATLLPVEGGEARPIRGWREDDRAYQWSPEGRFLYVGPSGPSSAKVSRLDLATGRREPWREITVADPTGVIAHIVPFITPDGRAYAYDVWRSLNDLYLVQGLK
jgi:eukaryotic-like serine/threonine-protein kinase